MCDSHKAMTRAPDTPTLLPGETITDALERLQAEVERLRSEIDQPHLGLATTRELLDELRARIEMHALGGLDYRTVDGEKVAALEHKP
jgi:hypothetical protein